MAKKQPEKQPERRYWLMKSEPDVYSLEDLERDGSTYWEGVRNYQARNFMRDDMRVGDPVLYYHANAKPPGVVGLARISREGDPDPEQSSQDHGGTQGQQQETPSGGAEEGESLRCGRVVHGIYYRLAAVAARHDACDEVTTDSTRWKTDQTSPSSPIRGAMERRERRGKRGRSPRPRAADVPR